MAVSCTPSGTDITTTPVNRGEEQPDAADPFDPGLRAGATPFALYLGESDAERAWTWLCTAALKAHPVAQNTLATHYRDGRAPVDRDPVRAYLWYSQALANGLAAADALRRNLEKSMTLEELDRAQQSAKTWKPGGCHHFGG